tara:strand:- start:1402 stop:1773 length:372 start_codon:yes stop_codon:yes gene_type:complete
MTEYFDGTAHISAEPVEQLLFKITHSLPVQAARNHWEVVASPNRLMRDYEFSKFSELQFFINEILEYQEEVNHHAKLTVEHLKVRVEVWTHNVDDVTEIDKEFAIMADHIYEDVQHYELQSQY